MRNHTRVIFLVFVMASKRKVKKHRKMVVKQTIDAIKKYRFPIDRWYYGGGYFIFSFGKSEFNLHVVFRDIPMMKFGIWKTKHYGDKDWYYFAECIPYIDKFKPSRSSFEFESLESMMEWVGKSIKDPSFYVSELENMYCDPDSEYRPHCFQNIENDYKRSLYEDSHNWFSPEEYETYLKAFNEVIKSIDTEKFDVIWRNTYGYKDLYDVWYYPDDSVTDEECEELFQKFRKAKCFIFEWRPLPSHFFKHKYAYHWKIHPENERLYFNKKKHYKYFCNENNN